MFPDTRADIIPQQHLFMAVEEGKTPAFRKDRHHYPRLHHRKYIHRHNAWLHLLHWGIIVLQAEKFFLTLYLFPQFLLRGHIEHIFRGEQTVVVVQHGITGYVLIRFRTKNDTDGWIIALAAAPARRTSERTYPSVRRLGA